MLTKSKGKYLTLNGGVVTLREINLSKHRLVPFGLFNWNIGTILYFQITGVDWPVLTIMVLAIVNGLLTSILLETLILMRSLAFAQQ